MLTSGHTLFDCHTGRRCLAVTVCHYHGVKSSYFYLYSFE